MSKLIYNEAVETLNKYRNQNYNSTDKDEVELANAINVILPNYVKQEKLLELYIDLVNTLKILDNVYGYGIFDFGEIIYMCKKIKEKENVNN